MTRRRTVMSAAAVAAAIAASGPFLVTPTTAGALNPIKPICAVAGLVNGMAQKACSVVGQVTGAAASTATTALTVAAVVAWAVGGARFLLHETAHVLAKTTAPQLTSTWFSSTYWQVAGISAVLTLPFLFAAAVQALLRSDLSLLIRSTLGYLPLALLAVAIAAPLTMLLLAASDQLSAIVSSAAGNQSAHFLDRSAGLMGSISTFVSSSFVGFLVALLTAAGAIVLWMELLVREAAVYVIVLMLPLAFAAFVWPARRIWAVRSIELLIALILSKFAIVAVLSLGGAALAQSANRSVTGLLAGAVLMALAAFAPWAMLRVVPLTEIASSASASLHSGGGTAFHALQRSDAWTAEGEDWASKTAQMRRTAETNNGASPPANANPLGDANPPGVADPPGETTDGDRASPVNGTTAATDRVDATTNQDLTNANVGADRPDTSLIDLPAATSASGEAVIQRVAGFSRTPGRPDPAGPLPDDSTPGRPDAPTQREHDSRRPGGERPVLDLERAYERDSAGLVDPTPPSPQPEQPLQPQPESTPSPQPQSTPSPQPEQPLPPHPDPAPPPQPDGEASA